jgi:hypothetical protein
VRKHSCPWRPQVRDNGAGARAGVLHAGRQCAVQPSQPDCRNGF